MKNFNKILIAGLILLMPLQAFCETYYIDRYRIIDYNDLEDFIEGLKKHDKHKNIKYEQISSTDRFDVKWIEEFKLEISKG